LHPLVFGDVLTEAIIGAGDDEEVKLFGAEGGSLVRVDSF
jgi:hypothetical protein